MTIIDCLRDARLLGAVPAFRDLSTWRRWLVFLAAVYGLPLSALTAVGVDEAEALAIFTQHTGRTTYAPPAGGYGTVLAIVGRQAGKDRIGSAITTFEAVTAPPEPDGTETYAILVAQDQRSSLRTLFSYASAPFDLAPALSAMVPRGWRGLWRKARRADSLTLSNGVRIAVYPCRPAAVRGLRARVVVLDELAFYRNSENVPLDAEMIRAVRPTLATTGGKLVCLTSPYGQSGAAFEMWRKHVGRDDSLTLVWVATAPEMNPTLSSDYLTRMREEDPEAYRSEVLGEFREGLATFFDADALAACVEAGVRERQPEAKREYVKFDDPASGSGKDAWTAAIAHRDGERVVLDVVRAWRPPFNPSSVIAESVELGKPFGLRTTTGDKYAPGFVSEGFRSHGVTYQASERDRSAIYLETLPLVNSGRAILLDEPNLLRELRGLERRRGSSGRDRVDHAPGAHDDRANSACGAIVLAARVDEAPLELLFSGSGLSASAEDRLFELWRAARKGEA